MTDTTEWDYLSDEFQQEIINYQKRIAELETTTYCAYCGARFTLDDKAAAQVTEHIYTCEKHPMRQLEAERDTQRELIGRPAEAIFGEYHDMRVRVKELELKWELAQGTIAVCENYIKELQEERRWIPISERLPKDGELVLTMSANWRWKIQIAKRHSDVPQWFSDDGWETENKITHWMELPKPIEEE